MFKVIRNLCERKFFDALRLPTGFPVEELKEAFREKNNVDFNVFSSIHRDVVRRAIGKGRIAMRESMFKR